MQTANKLFNHGGEDFLYLDYRHRLDYQHYIGICKIRHEWWKEKMYCTEPVPSIHPFL